MLFLRYATLFTSFIYGFFFSPFASMPLFRRRLFDMPLFAIFMLWHMLRLFHYYAIVPSATVYAAACRIFTLSLLLTLAA